MIANIFSGLPDAPALEEAFLNLLERPAVRIERIVSNGQASPPGFWYDQEQAEWVILLSGEATLRFENEARIHSLKPGDYLLIPARRRHRVEWTDPTQTTIWLAVHFADETA